MPYAKMNPGDVVVRKEQLQELLGAVRELHDAVEEVRRAADARQRAEVVPAAKATATKPRSVFESLRLI